MIVLAVVVIALIGAVQYFAGMRERLADEAYPPSGRIIDVGGTAIHLHVSGEGPAVVLIHGASGSLRDFTYELTERLSARYRVVAVDRPGHGWSERPEGYGGAFATKAESPALQADLLRRAVATLGIERPIVVGHSYGGAVALAWALDAPRETAGVVLLGAASMPWPGGLDFLYRLNASLPGSLLAVPAIAAFASRAQIESSVAGIFAPQPVPENYLAHFGPLLSLSRRALRANAQQVNSLRPHLVEMSARYPGLDLPVEALHGTADETVPMRIHSEPLVSLLPDAKLTRIEGAGHMPHHAAPDAAQAAIDRIAVRAGLR